MLNNGKKLVIVAGHYGSGKTNIAVNLAMDCGARGEKATLVDLDIVNPYFRAADATKKLIERGIRVITTVYANTNLDIPAVSPEVARVFTDGYDGKAIFDVGGDDAGAIALGRYFADFEKFGYEFYFCVNFRRIYTQSAADALQLLREIEAASRLKATAIINNTNLGEETDAETVRLSLPLAEELSRLSGLPILAVTALPEVAEQLADIKNVIKINNYTKSYF